MTLTPNGSEFRVNTYTTNQQRMPAIATDSSGNFVVTWASLDQDGSNHGIYAQRYNSAGVPLGSEFRVNTFTTGRQIDPAIAADSSGNFVVTWDSNGQSNGQDGISYDIYAQRYNSAGVPQGSEFRVNTYTTLAQDNPAIATDSSGNFVVTWQSDQDGSLSGIYAQRYNSAGVPQGSEFRVNTYTTDRQVNPAIATDSSGNFVVTWVSLDQDGSDQGIYAQRYNSAGVPQGSEFRVNTFTANRQVNPKIATDSSGNFVVTWDSLGQDGDERGIYAQRYNSAGVPQGSEFRVNTYTTDRQVNPAIATDSSGNFVVTWDSFSQDGFGVSYGYGIYAQRYNSAGVPQGSEFRVNTYTTNFQRDSAIATDSSGNFVVTWNSFDQDGSSYGVYAQRYTSSPISPISPIVTIGATDPNAAEAGNDPGTFQISRTGATTTALNVNYTIAGTATNGVDYTALTGTVTIPVNSSSVDVTITPFDDLFVESQETVTLILTDTADYDLNTTGAKNAVTIADNDILPVNTPITQTPIPGGLQILGTNGNDVYVGTTNNETIFGLPGNDILFGQGGNDSIHGGSENDSISGGLGDDTLIGGLGNDSIRGDAGVDTLTGDSGNDIFVYSIPSEGGDTITDFTPLADKFSISQAFGGGLQTGALPASQFVSGLNTISATLGAQRFIYDKASGILRFDADGNGAGASSIIATLSGSPALTSSDILVF